jgi:hypothetical protein
VRERERERESEADVERRFAKFSIVYNISAHIKLRADPLLKDV